MSSGVPRQRLANFFLRARKNNWRRKRGLEARKVQWQCSRGQYINMEWQALPGVVLFQTLALASLMKEEEK